MSCLVKGPEAKVGVAELVAAASVNFPFTRALGHDEDPRGVFSVIRPNPMLHFAPFLSTHFFPCLNPIFKNGSFLSVVALVSVTF